MTSVVFDTSAMIALIKNEPGADVAHNHLHNALCLTVNFAEAVAYFSRKHGDKAELRTILEPFSNAVTSFDKEVSFLTGYLSRQTRQYGLSLGDRACLATAMACDFPVLTADRVWKELEEELNVEIQLIR